MQGRDEFLRPELMISWFEVEGPLFECVAAEFAYRHPVRFADTSQG